MQLFRFISLGLITFANKLASISTANMSQESKLLRLQRFLAVKGIDDKENDIIYYPPENQSQHEGNVVFFGGDVQDFPEAMLSHRDNKRYVKWNLENTAEVLHKRFPNRKIYVVRPSRMHLNTFSCFENFVPGNDIGSPRHSASIEGLKHLSALLRNAETLTTAYDSEKTCHRNKASNVIVGFSKGCVVLNQLLYEFKVLADGGEKELQDFVQTIDDMYWLDGGHSGGSGTWVTDKSVLRNMLALKIGVHIHVTPYQVKNSSRPWNGKEEKTFRETLKQFGIDVKRHLHFEDEIQSLEFHFKVLEVF